MKTLKVTGLDDLKSTQCKIADGDMISGYTGNLTVEIMEDSNVIYSTIVIIDCAYSLEEAKTKAVSLAEHALYTLVKICRATLAESR